MRTSHRPDLNYAVGNFYKEIANGPTVKTVCDQHNHIIPAEQSA